MAKIDLKKHIEVITKAVLDSLDTSSNILVQESKENAPSDTGALKNSIKKIKTQKKIVITATASHAVFVEYGTFKDAPKSFMRKAFDSNSIKIAKEAERAATNIISKINNQV
jgi:HK97 gp10 family phage protein